MSVIEIGVERPKLTSRQRFSDYFVVGVIIVSLVIAVNLRSSILDASLVFNDRQAGIRAEYPVGWLLESSGDVVFRVRDLRSPGFKTTIQIRTQPVTVAIGARNLLDALTFQRSQTLAAYRVLSRGTMFVGDREALTIDYAYAFSEDNPFLEAVPVVVRGIDVVVIDGNRAIIISFSSDANRFLSEEALFERFLNALDY